MISDTENLVLFYHLITEKSFSKAAEKIGITKSVISRRITQLEKNLGVQLLYRTTRHLTLTEAGTLLFEHAQNVHNSVENTLNAMAGLGDKVSGKIRISVPALSGEMILPSALAAFSQSYPDVHIEMDLDNRFVDLVKEGFDFVIRTGVLPNSTHIARHLIDVKWVICGSRNYFEKHPKPYTPEALLIHNCLVYTYQACGANEWAFSDENDIPYTIKVKGNFSSNNNTTLKNIALSDQGLIYVPKVLVAKESQQGILQQVLDNDVAKYLGMYAVYPYTRQQPRKVKLLIDHLKTWYQSQSNSFC